MPLSSIPPNLSTSQYQHLVLEALGEIAGPGSALNINPPILSTADYRHLVLHALQYIAVNSTSALDLPPYNLIESSEDLTQGIWLKANTTVLPNAAISPDGTASADALLETSTFGYHALSQGEIPSVPSNSVRNSEVIGTQNGVIWNNTVFVGAGVIPDWGSFVTFGSMEVVGSGTELGMRYVDVRISGTNTSPSNGAQIIAFNSFGGCDASNGQTWTSSGYVRLVGGSLSNVVAVYLATQGRESDTASTEAQSTIFVPSSTYQRVVSTKTMTNPLTAKVSPDLTVIVSASSTVDITLRIAAPQLERSPVASTYVPTTGTAVQNQGVYTASIFAKANGRSKFALQIGIIYAEFNLESQTTFISPGNSPLDSASITSFGNGWFRCSYTRLASAGEPIQFAVLQDGTIYEYAGNPSLGMFLWGAQLVYGDQAGQYVRTSGPSSTVQVDKYFTSGTWTKPRGARTVAIYAISGGGGGGSGRRSNAAESRFGGGGGGGGAYSFITLPADVLSATETVTVGAGGIGGAAQTVNGNNGINGTGGGASTFGPFDKWCKATGGSLGAGGSTTAGGGGNSGFGTLNGANGGSSNVTGTAGNGANSGGSAPGGGGGGGISAAPAFFNGGSGGVAIAYGGLAAAGGVVGGTVNGANGGSTSDVANTAGYGAGGGAASSSGAGGNGGTGGKFGGGGGGGGAASAGQSGAGGNGGQGAVLVFTYF
jgi:hypothetical protein